MEQRSNDWHNARCGMITASQFALVMSTPRILRQYEPVKAPDGKTWLVLDKEAHDTLNGVAFKTKKETDEYARSIEHRPALAKVAQDYRDELVAEMDSGVPVHRVGTTRAMAWGNEYEDAARLAAVELLRAQFGREDFHEATGENAFITHPKYAGFGCSPDFLVGSDALGEIKCPANAGRHVTAALSTQEWFHREHRWQIQGSLWVTGRHKYYVVTYNPRSRARQIAMAEVDANPKAIADLEKRLLHFRQLVLERLAQFRGQSF